MGSALQSDYGDAQSERYILAALINSNDESLVAEIISSGVHSNMFRSKARAKLFEIAMSINESGGDVNYDSIQLKASKSLPPRLKINVLEELSESVFGMTYDFTPDTLKMMMNSVKTEHVCYMLQHVADTVTPDIRAARTVEDAIGIASKAFTEKVATSSGGRSQIVEASDEIARRALDRELAPPIPTGLPQLDTMFDGGPRPGNNVLIAARTGVGKTSFALWLVSMMAELDYNILYISLEMSIEEISQKIISIYSQVPYGHIRRGTIVESDKIAIERGLSKFNRGNIKFLECDDISLEGALSSAALYRSRGKLDIVFIDYLQLLRLNNDSSFDSSEAKVAALSRGVKQGARRLGIPIISLVQLNRGPEARPNKRPVISDMRGSGALEQDADGILLLHRPGMYDDGIDDRYVQVRVDKNRMGDGTAVIHLTCKPEINTYYDKPLDEIA